MSAENGSCLPTSPAWPGEWVLGREKETQEGLSSRVSALACTNAAFHVLTNAADCCSPHHPCTQASQPGGAADDSAADLRRHSSTAQQLRPWEVDFSEVRLLRGIGAGSFGRASCFGAAALPTALIDCLTTPSPLALLVLLPHGP